MSAARYGYRIVIAHLFRSSGRTAGRLPQRSLPARAYQTRRGVSRGVADGGAVGGALSCKIGREDDDV